MSSNKICAKANSNIALRASINVCNKSVVGNLKNTAGILKQKEQNISSVDTFSIKESLFAKFPSASMKFVSNSAPFELKTSLGLCAIVLGSKFRPPEPPEASMERLGNLISLKSITSKKHLHILLYKTSGVI